MSPEPTTAHLRSLLPGLMLGFVALLWLSWKSLAPDPAAKDFAVLMNPALSLEEQMVELAAHDVRIERQGLLPGLLIVSGTHTELQQTPNVWLIAAPLENGGCLTNRQPHNVTIDDTRSGTNKKMGI